MVAKIALLDAELENLWRGNPGQVGPSGPVGPSPGSVFPPGTGLGGAGSIADQPHHVRVSRLMRHSMPVSGSASNLLQMDRIGRTGKGMEIGVGDVVEKDPKRRMNDLGPLPISLTPFGVGGVGMASTSGLAPPYSSHPPHPHHEHAAYMPPDPTTAATSMPPNLDPSTVSSETDLLPPLPPPSKPTNTTPHPTAADVMNAMGSSAVGAVVLNMIVSRYWFDLMRNEGVEARLTDFFQKLLYRAPLPSYVGPLELTRLKMGTLAPVFSDVKPVGEADGTSHVRFAFRYSGEVEGCMQADITTKLDITETGVWSLFDRVVNVSLLKINTWKREAYVV